MRIVCLSQVPQPINHDVASNGYDAWCLLETGADRWGRPWPIHLEAFGRGDYRPALYAYFTVPFVALLGPDNITAATRGGSATAGILSVLFLYFLIRRLYNWKLASWSALLMALSPWALQMSRFGHESSLTVVLPIMLLLVLSKAGWPLRKPQEEAPVQLSVFWMALFGVLVALSLYSYASMRLFLPAFLGVSCLICWKEWIPLWTDRRSRVALLVGGFLLLACSAPLIIQIVMHWDRINARAEKVSLFHQGRTLSTAIWNTCKQYIQHYSPGFLFVRGDPFVMNRIPGVGVCSWVMIILLPIGLFTLLWNRKDRLNRILLAWFLLFPIASATTTGGPHALRSACGVGILVWVGAIGLNTLFQYAASKNWTRVFQALALLAISASGVYLYHCYFVRFARSPGYAIMNQSDYCDAMRSLRGQWQKYDRIFITDHEDASKHWFCHQTYILVLMYFPVEPATFQKWDKDITYKPPPLDHFHEMQRMGPIVMSTKPEVFESFFGTFDPPPAESALIIARPGDFGGMPLLQTIRDSRGNVRLEIYEYQPSNYK